MGLTKPLIVTAGEPAGIGPEICSALATSSFRDDVVVIGDARQLDDRLKIIDLPFPGTVTPGTPDSANASTLLSGLTTAITGCLDGKYSGLVTAPIAKHVIADAGIPFSGHTEFLAQKTDTATPVMMLVAGDMRVALASTHLPLRDVAEYLTKDRIAAVLDVILHDLTTRFTINAPEVIVCGLNPHAGEGGHLGKEDDAIIRPVIEACRKSGANVRGPIAADTAFTPAAGTRDAVLAMYHDQGLPVLKYAGFGNAVNVTLGLPIIRTSVDHGTAFDIAGQRRADASSLLAAVELAATMASQE